MRTRLAMLALMAIGCGGSDDDRCVEVATDCEPLYSPTFDQIFTRTLEPTCGVSGSTCHSSEGAKNGLIFADPDQSYDLLLGAEGDRTRVVPGDPGCSLIVVLLERDGSGSMPPRQKLSEAERCTIRQWIANGAER